MTRLQSLVQSLRFQMVHPVSKGESSVSLLPSAARLALDKVCPGEELPHVPVELLSAWEQLWAQDGQLLSL